MFDVGFTELVLIFVIALVVLGPERLPKAARTVGLYVGRARSALNAIRTEVEREAQLAELREASRDIEQTLNASIMPPDTPAAAQQPASDPPADRSDEAGAAPAADQPPAEARSAPVQAGPATDDHKRAER